MHQRDEIAQLLMPALLGQLFAEGLPGGGKLNIYETAALRAYLGADALIARSTMPPMAQPAPPGPISIFL